MASLNIKPVTVEFGWNEFGDKKDALAYARGIVANSFHSHEESWVAVHKCFGGYLWEAHEGGSGKSHVRSAAKALEEDPSGSHWFSVGDRAYMIVMQDGKPFPHLLPINMSVEIMNSNTMELAADVSMSRYLNRGQGWLVTGLAMACMSSVFFIGSVAFYAFAYNPGPMVRSADVSNLPHAQYTKQLGSIGIEEIVEKLELKNGNSWGVSTRVHKVEGLDELRKQRRAIERDTLQLDKRREDARKARDKAELDQIDQEMSPTPIIDSGVSAEGNNSIPVGIPVAPQNNVGGN